MLDPAHPYPCRRGSGGTTPSRPMCNADRLEWRRLLTALVLAERIGPRAIHVARALLYFLGADGLLFPSLETLRKRASTIYGRRMTPAELRHDLAQLEAVGAVRRYKRRKSMPWPERGPRAERTVQDSNAYTLHMPANACSPRPPRQRPRTDVARSPGTRFSELNEDFLAWCRANPLGKRPEQDDFGRWNARRQLAELAGVKPT